MEMVNYPDRMFRDREGHIYKLFGIRLLKDDFQIVKSWFGCADVSRVELIGHTLHVYFENGYITIDGVEEISLNEYNPPENEEEEQELEDAINCTKHTTCQRARKQDLSGGYLDI